MCSLSRFLQSSCLQCDPRMLVEEEDDYHFQIFNSDCDIKNRTFLVEHDKLLGHEEISRSTISDILVDMGVPIESLIINRILSLGHQMASDRHYMGCKVLRMRVEIDVPPSIWMITLGIITMMIMVKRSILFLLLDLLLRLWKWWKLRVYNQVYYLFRRDADWCGSNSFALFPFLTRSMHSPLARK